MDAHHASNPWSVQQPRPRKQTSFHLMDESPHAQDPVKKEHLLNDDFFTDHKEVFFHTQQQQQQLLQLQHLRQLQQQLQQVHDRQSTVHPHDIITSDKQQGHNDNKGSGEEDEEEGEGGDAVETDTDSQATAWSSSSLGIDSPLNDSTSTLAESMTVITLMDSDLGSEEGDDVLEELVHQLKSEVQDSRATVYELESRLDMAEHSSRHIVEELKSLLAHTEESLAAKSGNPFAASARRVTNGEGEDSNLVYNRICVALQSLIDEAQLALERTTHAKLTNNPDDGASSSLPPHPASLPTEASEGTLLTLNPTLSASSSAASTSQSESLAPVSRDLEAEDLILEPRSTRRNSLLDKTRPPTSSYMLTSTYGGTDDVSKILWRQKHEEQHDRYRRSSQRLTLELEREFLLSPLTTDSEDSDSQLVWSTLPRMKTAPSEVSSAASSVPSSPTTPTTPKALQGILRTSLKSGAKTERMKKKYQVQFLNPDIESSTERHRREERSTSSSSLQSDSTLSSSSSSASTSTSTSTTLSPRQQQKQKQESVYQPRQQQQQAEAQPVRQYTHRSVGSQSVATKPSKGALLQLYDLWQQTWLRTRIMHVITGSVEVVIIIWVVIRASRATLSWLGLQPMVNVGDWLALIYGHRGSVGFSAKDIYAKILKDGVQMRQIKAWAKKEPEALVGDLVAGAVTSSSLLSPSKVVYGPAKRVMAQAATGVVLAYLSDGARRLIRKM